MSLDLNIVSMVLFVVTESHPRGGTGRYPMPNTHPVQSRDFQRAIRKLAVSHPRCISSSNLNHCFQPWLSVVGNSIQDSEGLMLKKVNRYFSMALGLLLSV